MKKIIVLVLVLACVLSLAACGKANNVLVGSVAKVEDNHVFIKVEESPVEALSSARNVYVMNESVPDDMTLVKGDRIQVKLDVENETFKPNLIGVCIQNPLSIKKVK